MSAANLARVNKFGGWAGDVFKQCNEGARRRAQPDRAHRFGDGGSVAQGDCAPRTTSARSRARRFLENPRPRDGALLDAGATTMPALLPSSPQASKPPAMPTTLHSACPTHGRGSAAHAISIRMSYRRHRWSYWGGWGGWGRSSNCSTVSQPPERDFSIASMRPPWLARIFLVSAVSLRHSLRNAARSLLMLSSTPP